MIQFLKPTFCASERTHIQVIRTRPFTGWHRGLPVIPVPEGTEKGAFLAPSKLPRKMSHHEGFLGSTERAWGLSSVVERLPSKHKALGWSSAQAEWEVGTK